MTDSDKKQALSLFPELRQVESRLIVYEELLRRWQSKINLVGSLTLPNIWMRHFGDSAQLARLESFEGTCIDFGSGAGFPGVVLAMLQSGLGKSTFHLIESDRRKCAFLHEVSRETQTQIVIHCARVETIIGQFKPDRITSRAMADMQTLVSLSALAVEKGAVALFLKGRNVNEELTQAAIPSNFLTQTFPSQTDPEGTIVRICAR